ncbi:hypothetical protein LAV73_06490 [Lysinibacillus xylanilyticus]|uniref:hypothetical protein n=1 Tax=Lysinibacillus xylanilyticus TaxID=582475 RepID=UPI002B24F646|nr:hypothetical protein [Lysinibacillus xylanilyticus]MEB2279648.1 hypothetical protein [Lysinibacillus xylanilyticus]
MGNRRITRSDKKVDVKPTISESLKTTLYKLAEICDEPVKDVTERLCNTGAVSEIIIEEIRKWFRRDYRWNNTITMGYPERPKLRITVHPNKGKVTIKFKQRDFDQLSVLAFSLDITPTTAAAVLIRVTLGNKRFMQWYLSKYLSHLEEMKIREIYRLLKL